MIFRPHLCPIPQPWLDPEAEWLRSLGTIWLYRAKGPHGNIPKSIKNLLNRRLKERQDQRHAVAARGGGSVFRTSLMGG